MDFERFIPEINDKWFVKHQTIYFTKGGSIPLLKKIDGVYYISLDRRATRKVIKLIKKLNELDVEFYLCDRMTIAEKHIHREDLDNIIKNYLYAISDEVFFDFIQGSEFDYINNLTNFLNLYDCHKTFKHYYDKLKVNHFEKMWNDWYTMRTFYVVKNEDIRNYYSILERQIKLNIFFS